MFDVYVNDRNGLLIVARGGAVPEKGGGAWRKKRSVRSVSDSIRTDIRETGCHRRNLVARPVRERPQAEAAPQADRGPVL
jgi:hypothetical protein